MSIVIVQRKVWLHAALSNFFNPAVEPILTIKRTPNDVRKQGDDHPFFRVPFTFAREAHHKRGALRSLHLAWNIVT